jgi:hypothetical protein
MKILAALLLPILLTTLDAGRSQSEQVYLDATFDDKVIDAPIGTGGGALGEPVWVWTQCDATVRSAPCVTPCLEIMQKSSDSPGKVVFELIDTAYPISGMVVVQINLWFEQLGDGHEYDLRVFPWVTSESLLQMIFKDDGRVIIFGTGIDTQTIGTAPVGRLFPLFLAFDLDARTYSIWLDEANLVANQPLGFTQEVLRQIWIGPDQSPVVGSRMWVDRIRVTDWMPSVPVLETTWGMVRAQFR